MSNSSSEGAVSIDVHRHSIQPSRITKAIPGPFRWPWTNWTETASRRLVPSTAQIATNTAGKHGTGMSGVPGFVYNTLAALACSRLCHSWTPTSHFPKSRTPIHGVSFSTSNGGFWLGDKRNASVFAELSRRKAVIFVQP